MENKAATHFSPMTHKNKSFKIPGSSIYDTHKEANSLANVLTPALLVKREEGKNSAIVAYKKQEEMRSLKMLRLASKSINAFNEKICEYIAKSDELVELKEGLEHHLQILGVSVEKIKEYGEIQERGFIRTEEREKIDQECKRKCEDEEKMEEERREQAKKMKVIPTVEGVRCTSFETGGNVEEENVQAESLPENVRVELEHLRKVTQQQKHIIESKTELLVDQDKEIERQASRIKKMKERMEVKEEEHKKKIQDTNEDDDEKRSKTGIEKDKLTPSGSGPIKLEKMYSQESLERWIPGYKAEKSSEDSTGTTPHSSSQPIPTTVKPSANVYLPDSSQPGNILLLKPTQQNVKTTDRRSGKTHPVPEGRRSKDKVYCENCTSAFSRKDQLQQHLKNDCLNPIRQFVCDVCSAGYYSEKAVREHYYKIHLKIYLYYCTKCNQGFSHLNRKAGHKGKCPNPKGEDVYASRAPFNEELEKTFKRRTIMPIPVPDEPTPETQPSKEEDKPAEGDQKVLEGEVQEVEPEVMDEEGKDQMGEDEDDDNGKDPDEEEADIMLENVGEINPEVMFGEDTEGKSATELLLKMAQGGFGLNKADVEIDEEDGEPVEAESLEVVNINQD